jgi:hypothetical protein
MVVEHTAVYAGRVFDRGGGGGRRQRRKASAGMLIFIAVGIHQ